MAAAGLIRNSIVSLLCLLAERPLAAPRALLEDAASVVQVAVLAEDRHAAARASAPRAVLRLRRSDCVGQVEMNLDREVVTSNLGGLDPAGGPPVIHIRNFVNLVNGQAVDLFISNLTEYDSNNPGLNTLKGEFNNINIKSGSVDLLFTFKDTTTLAPVMMPPFNLTIYDLDGPGRDVYAETVAIKTTDFTGYQLSPSTDVTVGTAGTMTEFGSSAVGEACDNPTTIEKLGVVHCPRSGTVDQKDRAVAVQMKGGQSSYQIGLRASEAVRNGRNFLFGVPAYLNEVCHSPTPSPTPAPTSDVATSFGDPHVSNLRGERFDILQNDNHTFLVIPRGSTEQQALLHVLAKVDPLGELCSGLLYVSSLRFTGLWVGDVGVLEFSTSLQGPMDAEQAVTIKVGASSFLKISEFKGTIPESFAEITEFRPTEPRDLNQHVDILLVKLKLGPTIAKVRAVYQKEKSGFSNSLWLTTSGMRHVHQDIGGILGLDNHTFAASSPRSCVKVSGAGPSSFVERPIYHGSIHAAATLDDEDTIES